MICHKLHMSPIVSPNSIYCVSWLEQWVCSQGSVFSHNARLCNFTCFRCQMPIQPASQSVQWSWHYCTSHASVTAGPKNFKLTFLLEFNINTHQRTNYRLLFVVYVIGMSWLYVLNASLLIKRKYIATIMPRLSWLCQWSTTMSVVNI